MSAIPGWYDDPSNGSQIRWWDGAKWSTHVAPRPGGPRQLATEPAPVTSPIPVPTTAGRRGARPTAAASAASVASMATAPPAARRRMRPRTITILAVTGGLLFLSGTVAAGNAAQNAMSVASFGNVSTPTPTATPKATPTKEAPKETFRTISETEPVPFNRATVEDGAIAQGTTSVTQVGADGVRTMTYRVTLRDGVEVDRALTTDEITTAPVDEITTVGTYVAPPPPPKPAPVAAPAPAPAPAPVQNSNGGCDPNYSGQCVPIASDVDCGGGSGNGPAYVWGAVRVVGNDIYDLDRDGDGIACDA